MNSTRLALLIIGFSGIPFAHAATGISLFSEESHAVGQGEVRVLDETNGAIIVEQLSPEERHYLNIIWEASLQDRFTFTFVSEDNSSPLAPGLYSTARNDTTGLPTLVVSGNSMGCDSEGKFEIYELEYDDQGVLSKFAVDVVHRCDRDPSLLTAKIRFNSELPFQLDLRVATEDDLLVEPGAAVTASIAHIDSYRGEVVDYQWSQIFGDSIGFGGQGTSSIDFIAPVTDSEYEVLVFEVSVTNEAGEIATDQITVVASEVNQPSSEFWLIPDPDSFIGGGVSVESQIDTQYLTIRRVRAGLLVDYLPPGEVGWHLEIAPPWDESLRPGRFHTAFSVPFRPFDKPGVDFGITGRACNETIGYFNILDIGFALNRSVERLAVNAEIACVRAGFIDDYVEFRLRHDSHIPMRSRAPIADPGPDLVAFTGDEIVLDSFATRNDFGEVQSYEWRQVNGSTVNLSGGQLPAASFHVPEPSNGAGSATFDLTVTNDAGRSDTQSTVVQILGPDDPKSYIRLLVDPDTGYDFVTDSSDADFRLDPNSGYLDAEKIEESLRLNFTRLGIWRFEFASDAQSSSRSSLTTGLYDNASRSNAGRPYIVVTGPGRGCNTTEGSFEVFEYQEDLNGNPTRVAINFVQRCDGGAPLKGIVRFNSAFPPEPPVVVTPPATSGGGGGGGGGGGVIGPLFYLAALIALAIRNAGRGRPLAARSSDRGGRASETRF